MYFTLRRLSLSVISTAVMSHWSAPRPGPFNRDQRIMYAMSVAHIRKQFKKLVLVTDSPGVDQLIHDMGLPFDHYTSLLDSLPQELAHVWAMGKVMAYGYWPEPFVHWDFDILCEKPLPERMLKAKVCVERVEGHLMAIGPKMCEHFKWLPKKWVVAMCHRYAYDYNCGIFGGNDIDRIREYVADSLKVAMQIVGRAREVMECGGTLSRFLEQWPIGRYWDEKDIEVLTDDLRWPMAPQSAKRLGYYHFQGDAKHRPMVKVLFERRLLEADPALAVRAGLPALPVF